MRAQLRFTMPGEVRREETDFLCNYIGYTARRSESSDGPHPQRLEMKLLQIALLHSVGEVRQRRE